MHLKIAYSSWRSATVKVVEALQTCIRGYTGALVTGGVGCVQLLDAGSGHVL